MSQAFNADSTAKERCYIVPADKYKKKNKTVDSDKFQFQFNPTSIPYGRSANYSVISSPGMSYPLIQYSGGAQREFSFEVFYYDRPFSGKINKARNYLMGYLPPENNTKKFTKPKEFYLAYGYFVKKCVLKDLQVNDEWLDSNGRPIMTRFTLTCIQIAGD